MPGFSSAGAVANGTDATERCETAKFTKAFNDGLKSIACQDFPFAALLAAVADLVRMNARDVYLHGDRLGLPKLGLLWWQEVKKALSYFEGLVLRADPEKAKPLAELRWAGDFSRFQLLSLPPGRPPPPSTGPGAPSDEWNADRSARPAHFFYQLLRISRGLLDSQKGGKVSLKTLAQFFLNFGFAESSQAVPGIELEWNTPSLDIVRRILVFGGEPELAPAEPDDRSVYQASEGSECRESGALGGAEPADRSVYQAS